jgi:hypothetical protein
MSQLKTRKVTLTQGEDGLWRDEESNVLLVPDENPVKYEALTAEHRQEVDLELEAHKLRCMKSFRATRSGGLMRKVPFSLTVEVGIDGKPSAEWMLPSGNMLEMINQAVHQALVKQSPLLTNTVHASMKKVLMGRN